MDYTKIIFVSKENVLLGPMAEWIMKSILMDKSKQIMSRGLVVLFAEPRDQRVTELLMNHGVPCEEQVSEEFHAEQVDETTLVLTMNFTEKVKVLEDYGVTEHVYTLREFVQEEDAVGVVEIILILVVLIGLVMIFKDQLTSLVKNILSKITKQSNSI